VTTYTNSTDVTYTTATTIGSAGNTIVNTGSFNFNSAAATINNFYGSLTNSGTVSFKPSTVGTGSTANLGGSSDTLTQTGGTLSFSQLNGTSGASVYLQYGTINNDATSTIDLESAGASTISAPYVANLTNAGTIKVVDTSGTGMTSNWGNGTGTFNNSGNFSIDDSAATSGSTTNLNFKQITNQTGGTFSINVPAASTALFQVGSGGFTNNGTWSITSHGTGAGNIQFLGAGTAGYTNNGTINVTDANLTFDQALKGTSGTVNLTNGADVTLNGTNSGAGQTFNFSGGDNTLDVANGQTFTGVIRGFSQGDKLDLNVTGTTSYDKTTGILTITSGSNTYTYDVGKGYTGTFSDSAGVVSYVGTTPCYLPGSMIRTPEGEKAVETLAIGDELVVWDPASASEKVEAIVWVGTRKIVVQPHLADDLSNYPVRILKDALSDGVPYKDMLITAEHCLFFEGKFVPARMLVNGRSIFYDRDLTTFDVYHVETAQHSVLIADGALSESFLDTENHKIFRQSGKVASLRPARALTWVEDAAAPLATDRAFVEPLFRQIEARSVLAGHDSQVPARTMVNDADLYLETENRTVIRQIRENNGRVMFMIPAGVESVRIVSNASRPCDAVGPFVDDRRTLGVLVGDVRLFEGNTTTTLTAHLQDADLSGWNNVEDGTMRWTGGNALLNLGQRPIGSIALMALQIHAAGPYLLADTTSEQAALQA